MLETFGKFVADENGATAIEYAMISGLLSIMIVAGATQIGTTLSGIFQALMAHV